MFLLPIISLELVHLLRDQRGEYRLPIHTKEQLSLQEWMTILNVYLTEEVSLQTRKIKHTSVL